MLELKRRFFAFIIAFAMLGSFMAPSNADTEFVNLSGTITAPAGFDLAFGRALIQPSQTFADVDGSGNYSILVPKDQEVEVVFLTTLLPTGGTPGTLDLFANWRKSFTFSSASTLNFSVPPPIKLEVNVVDGQDQLVPNVILDLNENQPYDSFTDGSGNTWTGIQRAGDNIRTGNPSSTGNFVIWYFPTAEWGSFTYRTVSGSARDTSPGFSLQEPRSIKVCLPLNLPESGSLPADCFGRTYSPNIGPSIEQLSIAGVNQVLEFLPGQELSVAFTVADDRAVASVEVSISKLGSVATMRAVASRVSGSSARGGYYATLVIPLSASSGETWSVQVVALDSNGVSSSLARELVISGPRPGDSAPSKSETVLLVQRAGSQLVIYVEEEASGTFEVFEDGQSIASFSLGGSKSSHVVEKRVTGDITIEEMGSSGSTEVELMTTRSLLWYQNFNLGLVNPSSLNSTQRAAVDGLARSYKRVNDTWTPRGQTTSKFICTGIFGPDASFADKVDARKRAKLACETAQSMNPGSEVSFWFQTKQTEALSYVNKVLVTVKGLETFVEASLN